MKFLMTILEAIALILGAVNEEELSESEIERMMHYAEHPLHINSASRRELLSSGLLSQFQCISLLDYIAATGPVMSGRELSLVDGFDSEIAEALCFFLSFDTSPPSGGVWAADVDSYADVKALNEDSAWDVGGTFGLRTAVSKGERLQFGLAGKGGWKAAGSQTGSAAASSAGTSGSGGQGKTSFSAEALSAWCVSSFSRGKVRLYCGDFNARFGQGLCAWNTMTLSDISTTSALIRRPTGLGVSQSLTGNYAHTGLGASFETGAFTLSAVAAVPGLKTVLLSAINSSRGGSDVAGLQGIVNCNWWGRLCSAGLTSSVSSYPSAYGWRTTADFAADFRGCFSGVDIASEVAWGLCSAGGGVSALSPRAVLSVVSPLGECFKLGSTLRYSSSKHQAALIGEYSSRRGISASLGLSLRHSSSSRGFVESALPGTNELRIEGRAQWKWAENSAVSLRAREKLNLNDVPGSVFDCRGDVSVGYGKIWASGASVRASRSRGCWGLVVYLEQSCRIERKLSAYLRAGVFSVDDWEGRIYVYEHDIKGRFNIPALYGRGVWGSLFASWRPTARLKLSSRLSCYSYPFMPLKTRKPTKLEARVLLSIAI